MHGLRQPASRQGGRLIPCGAEEGAFKPPSHQIVVEESPEISVRGRMPRCRRAGPLPSRRQASKEEFQATLRSATSTLPFVSGLNSTATRKMAKPTTVVTRIGPD